MLRRQKAEYGGDYSRIFSGHINGVWLDCHARSSIDTGQQDEQHREKTDCILVSVLGMQPHPLTDACSSPSILP